MIYQIVVPSVYKVNKTSNTKTTIIKFPSPFEIEYRYGKVKHGLVDWSSVNTIKDEILPFSFLYDEMEEV